MSRSCFIEVPCVAGKIVADCTIRSYGEPDSDLPGHICDGGGSGAEVDIDSAWIESPMPWLERDLREGELSELYDRDAFQREVGKIHFEPDEDDCL